MEATVKLLNKTVLVTGASKGIGRAISLGMAREGADVIVNYNTDHQSGNSTVEEIRKLGRKAMAVKADIGKVSEIWEMLRKIREEFATLDVLVSNAGITGWTGLFEITEEKWD